MSRNKIVWTGGKGRDEGKQYEITEMSPFKSFRWALKAANALQGVIPDDYMQSVDSVSIWVIHEGVQAIIKADPDKMMPLLDELLECVLYRVSADHAFPIREGDDYREYIEERQTLFDLYTEIMRVHVDF